MNNLLVKANKDQRVFLVGDLHGEGEFFFNCLQKLEFDFDKDILVCTGDLVDRGPNSYDLLTYFLYTKDNFYSVIGNHDKFLVDKDTLVQLYNGGGWILEHEKETLDLLGKRISEKFPYTITIETDYSRYGVVHAEVPYEFGDWDHFCENVPKEEAVWSRDFINNAESKFYKDKVVVGVECVFHGHTIVDKPFNVANRWYIDTGASYHGNMTFVELAESGLVFTTFNKDEVL